jgi:hypothetical protein
VSSLALKMPGESNPEFARELSEYLSDFHSYSVKRSLAHREELYKWCAEHLGEKYKDWFIYEGGTSDRHWIVNIRHSKKTTFFALKWNDIIINSFDRALER